MLVGGRSSRMGLPKGHVRWRGESLLARALAAVRGAGLRPLVVGDASPYATEGARVLADRPANIGPLGGLRSVLLDGGGVVLAVDMPFVDVDDLRELVRAGLDAPYASGSGFAPFPAWYAPSLLPLLDRQLERGVRSFRAFIDAIPSRERTVVTLSPRCTQDWDTPEDVRASGGELPQGWPHG
ncbi:MAG: molybdenum cofactor guanylyltransferase [Myxococcota bacterium]